MKVIIGRIEVASTHPGSVEFRTEGTEGTLMWLDMDEAEIMAAALRVMVERSKADAASWQRYQQLEREQHARNAAQ